MYALDARALEQLSFDLELPLLFSNLTVPPPVPLSSIAVRTAP